MPPSDRNKEASNYFNSLRSTIGHKAIPPAAIGGADSSGQILVSDSDKDGSWLPLGSAGTVLGSNGTDPVWVDRATPYYAKMHMGGSSPTHNSGGWQKVGAGGGTSTFVGQWDIRPSGVSAQVDTTNERLNVQKSGVYVVTAKVSFAALSGRWLLGIYINGSQGPYIRIPGIAGGGNVEASLTEQLSLTAGQYIEVWAYTDESASEAYNIASIHSNTIAMHYLGPAS